MPATELWKDVLEKFKAAGLNAVSVYWHWGLTAPRNDTLRFTAHNDLRKFFQTAQDVGILVIIRPGPYANAETAGGGIPGWATNLPDRARTNGTAYREAWRPYILGVARETAPFQYPDGPVIAIQSENEYSTSATEHIPGLDEHMQDIIDTLREGGITKIPTIHNDKNPSGQYARQGLGKVDLYGWDGYPLGFDCDNPSRWTELSTSHDTSHQTLNPAEPLALFEWQGGAFSYWSGPSYDMCYELINEQFANVYYKNNYAAEASIQNLYMTYGGTNWGNLHTHTIYSSYDYGAAIREDRTLSPKISELKFQSLFLHASPDYLLVGRIGNGTVGLGTAYSVSPDIFTTHLHAPQNDVNFYVVRQRTNQKTTDTVFQLKVNTTLEGEILIPKTGSLVLAGRESKILVTNYPFGKSKLHYSTMEVMTWASFQGDAPSEKVDTILLYALEGQPIEVAVVASKRTARPRIVGSTSVSASQAKGIVTISGRASGVSVVSFDNKRIIIADKKEASAFWAPILTARGGEQVPYTPTPDLPSVLVRGPYLVRSASLEGHRLFLTGDLNSTTTIEVFGSSDIKGVNWNGKPVTARLSELGSLRGTVQIPRSMHDIRIPKLEELEWRCADSLPEIKEGFDDTDERVWVVANKTSTKRPQQPTAGKFVLYAGEYGFHSGDWVWRGHFSGNATGVELSIQGGFSFGYSAFLNSHFLGSGQGTSHSQDGTDILSPTFNFTQEMLLDGENVLTIIHDSTGMNQDYDIDDEHKTPRGIRGYRLLGAPGVDFDTWKVAGNFGGENAPDEVRGPYNEGGWWFERIGAHLPGFDASSWNASCSPYQGRTTPGVTVYRTAFKLNIPHNVDIPLSFHLELDQARPHRALIFVNGWQFGRFISTHGPQTSFPVPEGIFNHRGENEVLISLWALNEGGAHLKKLSLSKRAVLESSKSAKVDIEPAPGWSELRGI
ncbi:hypothetical protein ONZ45_g9854 [Pleurotus djamor]|nr:hypothetical protein ONZ45_g9854 [Pleurotus djamor]